MHINKKQKAYLEEVFVNFSSTLTKKQLRLLSFRFDDLVDSGMEGVKHARKVINKVLWSSPKKF